MLLLKGSPERMESLSSKKSSEYLKASEHLCEKGFRALGIGYKVLGKVGKVDVKKVSLEKVVEGVTLSGIMCFENELKAKTSDSIK